jgi:hypothetical protein
LAESTEHRDDGLGRALRDLPVPAAEADLVLLAKRRARRGGLAGVAACAVALCLAALVAVVETGDSQKTAARWSLHPVGWRPVGRLDGNQLLLRSSADGLGALGSAPAKVTVVVRLERGSGRCSLDSLADHLRNQSSWTSGRVKVKMSSCEVSVAVASGQMTPRQRAELAKTLGGGSVTTVD